MNIITSLIDIFLHLDEHLEKVLQQFGAFTYLFLYLIIFAETGLVVAPFLPGDSLLFVAGTLAGSGHLNIVSIYLGILASAIIGDTLNYAIGNKIGPKVFSKGNSKIFKKEYLEKTREFYAKHGAKTIILARFLPILRTFAPFVAGIGNMHYRTFLFYNFLGGFLWVTLFTFAGYFFGGLEVVQTNFHYVVVGIIFVSIIPLVIEYAKHKQGPKMGKKQLEHATYKEIKQTLKEY